MRLSEFDDWARAHHGIITLETSGLSRSAWYRALDAGTLIRVHPLVARLPGTLDTPEQRIIAGVAACGDGALASHRSAARLWGIPRPDDDPVDVIDARSGTQAALDGVIVHRPVDNLIIYQALKVAEPGDVLVITNISSYPENRLQVFNRYGNLVLDRAPYNNDWDGRSQTGALFGEILPESTYYYVLDLGNDTEAYTGYIYLRR